MTNSDSTSIPRQLILVAALLLTVLATQLRYPPLSYPYIGQILVVFLAGIGIILPLWSQRLPGLVFRPHPALLPGFLFVVWGLIRWSMTGFSARGAEEIGTILWLAIYAMLTYWLTVAARRVTAVGLTLPSMFITALAVGGLICGSHAVWQYHFLYNEAYQQLLQSIGNRPPDLTELGLLDHLLNRRVAGVFGDPNNLATFLAIAFAASIEILTSPRKWFKVLGTGAIPLELAGIYYSGSRGGVLDVAVVLSLYVLIFLWKKWQNRQAFKPAITTLIVAACLILNLGSQSHAVDTTPGYTKDPVETRNSWQWRSNTVRERVYYLEVGAKMIGMSPLIGLGPGSVDQYFGRLKSPDARETKYLHNWIVQIGAELGAIGVLLAAWFLIAIALAALRSGFYNAPVGRALLIISLIIVADALIQVTWNQRELMSVFGIVCGFLMAGTVVTAEKDRMKKLRLAATVPIVGIFAISEIAYLGASSAKQLAADLAYAGDFVTAETYWQKASTWVANDPEPYGARASLALQQGRLMQARNLIEQALARNPDSAALHVQASEICKALRKEKGSDDHLTRALALYPSNPDFNYRMANQLQQRGRNNEALKFARRAAKYNFKSSHTQLYKQLIEDLETSGTKV